MTATEVKITSLTIIEAKPYENGDKLLASFDCETRGFRLHDCVLLRAKRGFLLAQAPRGEARRDKVRAIQILDKDLRNAMAEAAHAAFLALGGDDDEDNDEWAIRAKAI